jgi:hypothetical protein
MPVTVIENQALAPFPWQVRGRVRCESSAKMIEPLIPRGSELRRRKRDRGSSSFLIKTSIKALIPIEVSAWHRALVRWFQPKDRQLTPARYINTAVGDRRNNIRVLLRPTPSPSDARPQGKKATRIKGM